jgi:hypothetical protein
MPGTGKAGPDRRRRSVSYALQAVRRIIRDESAKNKQKTKWPVTRGKTHGRAV